MIRVDMPRPTATASDTPPPPAAVLLATASDTPAPPAAVLPSVAALATVTLARDSRPLRIQEASELVGLTPRSIRYYEEMGLLRPSARSQGDYRLYDASDLERLRFIRGLRDDAGFSLAEIGRLLEDEGERRRAREAFDATDDPGARRAILEARLVRIDGQVATLHSKLGRLQAMIDDAQRRRARLEALLAGLGEAR